MTGVCDPLSDDCCEESESDVPATAKTWRLMRTFSNWRANLIAHHHARNARRVIRLHRMNDYMLRDMGLTRLDDERPASEKLHPLPFCRSDDEDG
jgi:uncharacterized protein YjiS (DUF1127 family)